jgi:uncharacterized protein YkwD
MSRVRTLALFAVLAALLVVPSFASAASAPQKMLEKVNKIRANHGLSKLRPSRSLQVSATRYSRRMVKNGYFGHSSRIHASRRFRTLGEIIEAHFVRKPMVRLAARNWMNSGPHRSLILSRSFRHAGAGYAMGRYRGKPVTMWTMHFGRR